MAWTDEIELGCSGFVARGGTDARWVIGLAEAEGAALHHLRPHAWS
ncbi:MAG: hypothetical protein IPK07_14285 [Deltaproteobacteria bacterium]|nr:hypothetical protein [Deltaproteobacteria bacterium]